MSNELVVQDISGYDVSLYESDVVCNDFSSNDLAYSWLRIAQSNTEQQKKGSASQISGLEAGHFFNSLTSKVYGEEVNVIFQKFFHSFREQTPGDLGEFVRSIDAAEFEALKAAGAIEFKGSSWVLPSGNVIKETWNYMVLLPNDPEAGVVRLAIGAGGRKYCDAWNSMIRTARLPNGRPAQPYTVVWRIKLALETSPKTKKSFYTIGSNGIANVKRIGLVGPDLIRDAKQGYEFFQMQNVKVNPKSESLESEDSDTI